MKHRCYAHIELRSAAFQVGFTPQLDHPQDERIEAASINSIILFAASINSINSIWQRLYASSISSAIFSASSNTKAPKMALVILCQRRLHRTRKSNGKTPTVK
jgi:hypothetical protein